MRKLTKIAAAAAVAGIFALPMQSANAWWGWGPGYGGGGPWGNNAFGDMLGDGAFDFNMSGRGRGSGSGYGYGYNNPYYGYGYPGYGYGYPGYGYGHPGYGAPWAAPYGYAPQQGGQKDAGK